MAFNKSPPNSDFNACSIVFPVRFLYSSKTNRSRHPVTIKVSNLAKSPDTSEHICWARGRLYNSSYFLTIARTSSFERGQIISMRASSSVPIPTMALFNSLHRKSTGGNINPIIKSSNFPPSSLFKSLIKSRPYSFKKASVIA
uniref:CSON012054 protein n=1 Tax=Culicoides sonorensis TaxID=179676 RepID=A0A336KIQ6_CULSO